MCSLIHNVANKNTDIFSNVNQVLKKKWFIFHNNHVK